MLAVSEKTLKWLMCLYPPLLLQRIWVQRFSKGFRGVKVKINKSLVNKNFNGSIFGGTIFAAADPFFPVLFHQILQKDNKKRLKVWSKSASIEFLKPASTDLFFEINLTDNDIEHANEMLLVTGKFERAFPLDIYNTAGETCALVTIEVYIRDLDFVKRLF